MFVNFASCLNCLGYECKSKCVIYSESLERNIVEREIVEMYEIISKHDNKIQNHFCVVPCQYYTFDILLSSLDRYPRQSKSKSLDLL